MKTRKSFLNWAIALNNPIASQINHSSFLSINQRDYVFEVLKRLKDNTNDINHILSDYYHVESQRYHIFEKSVINEKLALNHIASAIQFCSKPKEKKRQSTFKVNLSISNYLVESSYLWGDSASSPMEQVTSHYLFIPSFLPIAPKEIHLIGLNALLLDIMNYEKEFTYEEFFELVKSTLHIKEDKLDIILLEYLENQILYYRTIITLD